MNESRNPFAETKAASRSTGAGTPWLSTTLGLILIVGGISAGWFFRQQTERLNQVRSELNDTRAIATRSESEAAELRQAQRGHEARVSELTEKLGKEQALIAELEGRSASNQARIALLESEKETAVQTRKGLEEQMRAELQSKDVTISQLQGKLTVNILDRILFDSGEAVLKPGGEAVLRAIASILEQHPTLKIHVIGHTDNVPIRSNSRSRFATNWELSTARALAAVRFLTEKAGVDPRRVGAVGYGEFRPLADNATPEGRAKNRRIAITMLADELAGADSVPVSTNAPSDRPLVSPESDNSDGK